MADVTAAFAAAADRADLIMRPGSRHASAISANHRGRARATLERLRQTMSTLPQPGEAPSTALADYARDVMERWVLTLDTRTARGDIFLDREAKGCPPVLAYQYERVMDGAELPRPCNYELLRILPPEGCEVHDWKRP